MFTVIGFIGACLIGVYLTYNAWCAVDRLTTRTLMENLWIFLWASIVTCYWYWVLSSAFKLADSVGLS